VIEASSGLDEGVGAGNVPEYNILRPPNPKGTTMEGKRLLIGLPERILPSSVSFQSGRRRCPHLLHLLEDVGGDGSAA
jgi:hypothetical protein